MRMRWASLGMANAEWEKLGFGWSMLNEESLAELWSMLNEEISLSMINAKRGASHTCLYNIYTVDWNLAHLTGGEAACIFNNQIYM